MILKKQMLLFLYELSPIKLLTGPSLATHERCWTIMTVYFFRGIFLSPPPCTCTSQER